MIKSSIKKIERAVTVVMAFLFCSVLPTASSMAESLDVNVKKPQHSLYFSLSDKHGFPLKDAKQSFGCEDKIYSVVELTNFEKGKHQFSVTWIDPSNVDREVTEYDFFVRNDTTRLWSWLSLKRATGAGMLQWLNPAAGLEEFVGPWTVEIRINGKKIDSGQFEVIC